MPLTRRTLLSGLAGLLALSGGCARGPKLVPVRGVVLHNGKPFCPGTIHFVPADAEGKQAYATLQLDGSFTLKTHGEGAGALPGVYRVTLAVGLGNPPDLAGYDDAQKTPVKVEVPADGLDKLTLDVPLRQR